MGEVIEFPGHEKSWNTLRTWVVDVCLEAGLTREMENDVAERYHEFHNVIFDMDTQFTFPADAALQDWQAEKVMAVVREMHLKSLSSAAHIVIGLLARERRSEG